MVQQEGITSLNEPKTWFGGWQSKDLFLALIATVGVLLTALGIYNIPAYSPKNIFLLFALMAVAAQIANTSVPVSDRGGITFEVGTAVSVAAIPIFGSSGAALIVALSSIGIWLLKSHDKRTWKKSLRQLGFNTGMWTISIFVAGTVFQYLLDYFGPWTILGSLVPWLTAAVLTDQLNIWLLLTMVRLQNGKQVDMVKAWRDNRWASGINILITSVGGGFLAFASIQYDWIGTIIFFLPIFLSAYAFALYVRQMKVHMDNMETIIGERTRELSEVVREKDAFLAVLTHDMKTPLTTIGLYSEILIKRPEILEDKPHLPQIILNNQQSLTEIVNNILDLEKLQVGEKLDLEFEAFDLVACLEYLLDSLSAQAERKEITLNHEFSNAEIMIIGDRQQIQRVFQNMLSNAIKYTPEGGWVRLEAYFQNEEAVVQIIDSGYGIPQNELPHIFERFRRVAKHSKVAVGTGLGLSIAKAIVEAHNGQITVTSEEDEGTTFTVCFPL